MFAPFLDDRDSGESSGESSLVVGMAVALLVVLVAASIWRVMRGFDRALLIEDLAANGEDRPATKARRRGTRNAYGGRRLPDLTRSGIEIPRMSRDSIECDDALSRGRPKECLLSDGALVCFECVESRTSARTCVHFDVDTTIQDDRTDERYPIARNVDTNVGYCVSANVAGDARSRRARTSQTSLRRTKRSLATGATRRVARRCVEQLQLSMSMQVSASSDERRRAHERVRARRRVQRSRSTRR